MSIKPNSLDPRDPRRNDLDGTLDAVNKLNAAVSGSAESIIQEIQRISTEAIDKTIETRPYGKTPEDTISFLRNRVTDLCIQDEAERIARQKGIRSDSLLTMARELGISVFLKLLDKEADKPGRTSSQSNRDSHPASGD